MTERTVSRTEQADSVRRSYRASNPTTIRTASVADTVEQRADGNGGVMVDIVGLASATGKEYTVYDMFGPYTEVVATGAFNETLAAGPDVVFNVNHGGLGFASTGSETLALEETERGLEYVASVRTDDPEVVSLLSKIKNGSVVESSMMFRIVEAEWNEAMDRRTITEIDLHRGDVSAVLYGANPHTEVGRNAETNQEVRSVSPQHEAAAEARREADKPTTNEPPTLSLAYAKAKALLADS